MRGRPGYRAGRSGGTLGYMTRFAIDAAVAVRIVREGLTVADGHQLVGPNLLRSDALALLYRELRDVEMTRGEWRRLLDGLAELRIRLLGDRVTRAVAWDTAVRLGWPDTYRAEYLAVAQLQADALVTQDAELARGAEGVVPVVGPDALSRP